MPAAHCSICLEHIPIDSNKKFLVFPCGHGWCKPCTNRLFRRDPDSPLPCPNCRKHISKNQGHALFVMLVDDSVTQQEVLLEGINKMGPDTPLVSVKKASKKLEEVAKEKQQGVSNHGKGVELNALLKAIEDFSDRIIPLYTKSLDQQAQISLLLADQQLYIRQRDNLENKLKQIEPLQAKIAGLEKDMQQSDRQRSDALQLAEQANKKLGQAHQASASWRKKADEVEDENKRLVGILERHKKAAKEQKERLKSQKDEIASLKRKLADAERETASDAAHGYDGDFSGHEQSRTERSLALSSPHRPLTQIENEPPLTLDFVGMPPPRFPSEWQIPNSQTGGVLKKVNRRPAETRLPLELDNKGRPTKAVVLGPRHVVHVRR